MQAGQFTASGSGHITAGETLATTDDQSGNTDLIDFTWTGTYTVTVRSHGHPEPSPRTRLHSWKCYDMTNPAGPPDWTGASVLYPLLNWPNQIMPVPNNAGSFVYQPVTASDWIPNSHYRNLYDIKPIQIFPT